MKKLIISGSFALMLGLSACTGSPAPAVTVTETATATVTPSPSPSVTLEAPVSPVQPQEPTAPEAPLSQGQSLSDADFVALVRKNNPVLLQEPANDLVGLAHSGCKAFQRGVTFRQIVGSIVSGDATNEQKQAFGYVIGAGVANYCPEYKHLIK